MTSEMLFNMFACYSKHNEIQIITFSLTS